MALQLANVALSDTFDTWRIRTNQIIVEAGSLTSTSPQTFTANTTFSGNLTVVGTLSGDAAGFDGLVTAPTISANALTGTITTAAQPNITSLGSLNYLTVAGDITADVVTANTFSGSGASLTSLSASQLSTGTVPSARLVGNYSIDIQGNANTAAKATAVTLVATNTTDATHYLAFVDAATGDENVRTDTGLTYNPNSGTLNAVDFNATSDISFKESVAPINNALDIIDRLSGKSFNWKHTGKKSYGVIAQEVEEILPDIVSTNENGKSVNYNTLIALLIESNKQLNKKIKLLEDKIS